MKETTISVSKEFHDWLTTEGRKGESYEDIIRRVMVCELPKQDAKKTATVVKKSPVVKKTALIKKAAKISTRKSPKKSARKTVKKPAKKSPAKQKPTKKHRKKSTYHLISHLRTPVEQKPLKEHRQIPNIDAAVVNYINTNLENGITKAQLKSAFLKHGWDEEKVDAILNNF